MSDETNILKGGSRFAISLYLNEIIAKIEQFLEIGCNLTDDVDNREIRELHSVLGAN